MCYFFNLIRVQLHFIIHLIDMVCPEPFSLMTLYQVSNWPYDLHFLSLVPQLSLHVSCHPRAALQLRELWKQAHILVVLFIIGIYQEGYEKHYALLHWYLSESSKNHTSTVTFIRKAMRIIQFYSHIYQDSSTFWNGLLKVAATHQNIIQSELQSDANYELC